MKKILSFLMIFCLLFTNIASATNIGPDSQSDFENYAHKKIGFMLNLASQDTSSYGLENVNISNLKIGEMILPYEKIGADLVVSKDQAYFPIVNDGQVVLIMTIMKNSNNSLQAYLGTDFAKDLNKVYKNGDFVLFSEDETIALITPQKTKVVYGFKQKAKLKYSDFGISKKSISKSIATIFGLTKMKESTISIENVSAYSSMYKKLNVPNKQQPTDFTCWVTSAASIIEYKQGGSVDPYQLSKAVGVNPDTTFGQISDVKNAFSQYNISSTDKTDFYSAPVSDGFIIDRIIEGTPLVGGFHDLKTTGHMVVIDGYSISVSEGSVLLIMDPWYSSDRIVSYDTSMNNFVYNNKQLVTVIYPN